MKLAGLKFHIYVIQHICINIPTEYFEKYLRKEEIFMAQGFSKTHIDKVLYDAYGLRAWLMNTRAIKRTDTDVSILTRLLTGLVR